MWGSFSYVQYIFICSIHQNIRFQLKNGVLKTWHHFKGCSVEKHLLTAMIIFHIYISGIKSWWNHLKIFIVNRITYKFYMKSQWQSMKKSKKSKIKELRWYLPNVFGQQKDSRRRRCQHWVDRNIFPFQELQRKEIWPSWK